MPTAHCETILYTATARKQHTLARQPEYNMHTFLINCLINMLNGAQTAQNDSEQKSCILLCGIANKVMSFGVCEHNLLINYGRLSRCGYTHVGAGILFEKGQNLSTVSTDQPAAAAATIDEESDEERATDRTRERGTNRKCQLEMDLAEMKEIRRCLYPIAQGICQSEQ